MSARRNLALLVCAAALAACGGSSDASVTQPNAPTGTLIFRLDAQSCVGTGTLNFFLDGRIIGTATISVGASQSFPNQPAGAHVVGASETKANGFVWPSQTVTIPANSSFTDVLICG